MNSPGPQGKRRQSCADQRQRPPAWHGSSRSVTGFYRYVRNPIYVGFLIILIGQTLLFGSPGMLEYTAVAWCIGAAAVRFYEEPVLIRKFGPEYLAYRGAVRAWLPRRRPWEPG